MTKRRASTWGEEISLEYGKALRGYGNAAGEVPVYGTNGPVGWTDEPLAVGPGVILGRKGAYRGVHFSRKPFFVIDTAYYVVPKTELDMRWLYYAMIHHKLGEIDDGSPIPSTTRSAVYPRELEVPEIDEQRAIAAALGSLDDKIELNRQINETLEATARAIFKSWFVDFDPVHAKMEGRDTGLAREVADLFPERFNEEGLPEGWGRTGLGSQFDLSPRTMLSEGDELPYVEMAALPTSTARVTAIAKRSPTSGARFINGDALLARITPCLENGKAAYVDFLERDQVGIGSTEFIVFRPRERLSGIWAYLLMRNDDFRAHAIANMSGTSGRQRVSSDALAPWSISLPSIAVAEAFDAAMAPIFLSLKVRDDESSTLAALRDLLLPKLMSGEVSIKNAERLIGEAGA